MFGCVATLRHDRDIGLGLRLVGGGEWLLDADPHRGGQRADQQRVETVDDVCVRRPDRRHADDHTVNELDPLTAEEAELRHPVVLCPGQQSRSRVEEVRRLHDFKSLARELTSPYVVARLFATKLARLFVERVGFLDVHVHGVDVRGLMARVRIVRVTDLRADREVLLHRAGEALLLVGLAAEEQHRGDPPSTDLHWMLRHTEFIP